ncbi:MAG: hypothetical protein FWE44_02960 [Defluviitaleaceae bacterium]|nr:hypothetical protein [Defluviitaleaceae bacterium]
MDWIKLLIILLSFVIFFDNSAGTNVVPHNVNVLSVEFQQTSGHLILNVCSNVLNYGGTLFEYYFVQQLTSIAASFCDAQYFTLLISGELRELPEGIMLYRFFLH